jgi:hypothetical protein
MKKMIVVMMVAVFASVTFSSPAKDVVDTNVVITEHRVDDTLCNIRIRGTYDGKAVDVMVTVEAENCATAAGELLRAITAKK